MFGIRTGKKLAGLDMGSSAVKAVQLERIRKGYEVVCAGLAPQAWDAIVDGAISDGAAVAKAIEAVFAENCSKHFSAKKLSPMNVATSLSGPSVIVKRLTMPVATEEDLDKRIQEEVARSIPFDISEVSLSYQILAETETEMGVLLVATRNDVIQSHTRVLAEASKRARIMMSMRWRCRIALR
jgi:type IV pilus assembly protein PilM